MSMTRETGSSLQKRGSLGYREDLHDVSLIESLEGGT